MFQLCHSDCGVGDAYSLSGQKLHFLPVHYFISVFVGGDWLCAG